jgi:hypothetical protein
MLEPVTDEHPHLKAEVAASFELTSTGLAERLFAR